jgi:sirohydrochlorin ferrochelatase
MKNNKKIYLCILILLSISLYSVISIAQPRPATQPRSPISPVTIPARPFSAILVAHGSAITDHNQKVINLKHRITNPSLSALEVAFLGNDSQGKMDTVLNQFRARGTTRILLIPLSPCSYIRHAEIKILANDKANGLGMPFQFTLAPAMDDHPVAAEIIKEQARNKSVNPQNESLLLFAYGPVEELENITWLRLLEQMGERIGKEVGFKEVECATVRNHSADLIAEQSIIDLRRKARALRENGRVIVVPYVFEDGPYTELQSYLSGIVPPEDIVSEGFISNAKTKDWVQDVIRRGMNQPAVKAVNRHWSTEKGPKGNF